MENTIGLQSKQTLLSLPIEEYGDQTEGSKKLLRYIAQSPSLDQLPEKYRGLKAMVKLRSINVRIVLLYASFVTRRI